MYIELLSSERRKYYCRNEKPSLLTKEALFKAVYDSHFIWFEILRWHRDSHFLTAFRNNVPQPLSCAVHHLFSWVCDQLGNRARREQSATNKRYSWRHLYYTAFKNKTINKQLCAYPPAMFKMSELWRERKLACHSGLSKDKWHEGIDKRLQSSDGWFFYLFIWYLQNNNSKY
jgi:hypothetical protein